MNFKNFAELLFPSMRDLKKKNIELEKKNEKLEKSNLDELELAEKIARYGFCVEFEDGTSDIVMGVTGYYVSNDDDRLSGDNILNFYVAIDIFNRRAIYATKKKWVTLYKVKKKDDGKIKTIKHKVVNSE